MMGDDVHYARRLRTAAALDHAPHGWSGPTEWLLHLARHPQLDRRRLIGKAGIKTADLVSRVTPRRRDS